MGNRAIDIQAYPGDPPTSAERQAFELLFVRAQAALATNTTYLAQPAIPAGTLTAAQLGTYLRIIRDQLDTITKQNNAIIRLLLNQLDDISDT